MPDRAVGRDRDAVAQANDVALAGALRAVDAADDAHVVAVRDEVLVQVVDVGVDAARHRVDVRRDEADLHSCAPAAGRFVQASRTRPTTGVSEIAAGSVTRHLAAHFVAHGQRVLAHLAAERGELRLPLVCRAFPGRRARHDGRAQIVGGGALEGRERLTDVLGAMRVAGADRGNASVRDELPAPFGPAHAGGGRVERLDRVGMEDRVRLVKQAPDRSAAGAQRVGHERVGDDRDAALFVDPRHGRPERAPRPDALVDEQRDNVAAARSDLFTDDRPGGSCRAPPPSRAPHEPRRCARGR